MVEHHFTQNTIKLSIEWMEVRTFNARNNRPLLNGRGFFKTICIYPPEKTLLQVHVIKIVCNFGPVALK